MAITNYTELQAAVGNWLTRADLTARIPEFIALAEADIRRELKDKKAGSIITLTAGANAYVLPTAVGRLTLVRYDETTRKYPLREKTGAGLAEIRRSGTGAPQAYIVLNGVLYFDVTPDSAYQMEIQYIEALTPLSVGSPTNNTLTKSPDIYLYGALLQSAPFLEHDERLPMWEDRFEKAIMKENMYREEQELGAAPEMDLPVVFGDGC